MYKKLPRKGHKAQPSLGTERRDLEQKMVRHNGTVAIIDIQHEITLDLHYYSARARRSVSCYKLYSLYINVHGRNNPASILRKSTSGRHRPVSYPDGPMTARYRFT